METREFLIRARLDHVALEAWIEQGWLMPHAAAEARRFADIDLARAQLIRDLKDDFGINDEGVGVILDLVDQMHGLRCALRDLLRALGDQPAATRARIIAAVGNTVGPATKVAKTRSARRPAKRAAP